MGKKAGRRKGWNKYKCEGDKYCENKLYDLYTLCEKHYKEWKKIKK